MTPARTGPPEALRVLDTGAGDPLFNMALDEALLRGSGPPTLRLYRWTPPGLSLGRFQACAPFLAVPGRHRIVRRRTGGGAIYHDDEITFALTLDLDRLPVDIDASYVLVHRAVQQALTSVGVLTELVPASGGAKRTGRPSELWCFAKPGPHDLVLRADGRKIVGSAQRRMRAPRGRVLHHGSIVLRAPEATPMAGAVQDVADARSVESPLQAALVVEIAVALGLRPAPVPAPTAEELRAAEVARREFEHPDAAAS